MKYITINYADFLKLSNRTHVYIIILLLTCYALQTNAQVYEKTPELHGDSVVFPLTLIDAYPFISATVNGIEGKFMFDTGTETAIILNDNLVVLPDKKTKGNGSSGSGQSYKTSISDTVREIKFRKGPVYRNLENIMSANYDFLQRNIAPDFLGFIGHNFFKDYLFKIDYIHRKVTFYKNSEKRRRNRDFLSNEKVLAVIDFELRKLPNHPMIKMKIDGIDVLGAFDTGQNGSLQLDAASMSALNRKGTVRITGKDSRGDTLVNIKNIAMDRNFRTVLKGVEFSGSADSPSARKALNITEANVMNIGYRFLSLYKTVWDYQQKRIYILEY